MAVSQARRGFPGMNRSPRPTRRPTQKIWPTISVTNRAKKNRKPKGPTSLQLGASQKAPKATNEKVASRLCALRNAIILAIFVPEESSDSLIIDFPTKPPEVTETSGPSGFTFQSGRNRHRNLSTICRSSHPHHFLPETIWCSQNPLFDGGEIKTFLGHRRTV